MTNLITLTIPNDDSTALYHLGKSLLDMSASISGVSKFVVITRDEYETLVTCKTTIDTSEATAVTDELVQTASQMMDEPEIDTTAQQVESLAASMGDDEKQAVSTTDSTGTPWDERIHSTSKALNADGTWRLRRKPKDMDEMEWAALVESIKNELHTQTPVMTDEEIKTLESVSIEPTREEVDEASNKMLEPPVTPPGDDFHTDAGVVTEQTVAGIPPLPVPPPVVVAPPVTEQWDFPRLMTFLTERHGKIDVATVNTLLAQDGMLSVQELNAHPDKIGPFVARVKAHLGE